MPVASHSPPLWNAPDSSHFPYSRFTHHLSAPAVPQPPTHTPAPWSVSMLLAQVATRPNYTILGVTGHVEHSVTSVPSRWRTRDHARLSPSLGTQPLISPGWLLFLHKTTTPVSCLREPPLASRMGYNRLPLPINLFVALIPVAILLFFTFCNRSQWALLEWKLHRLGSHRHPCLCCFLTIISVQVQFLAKRSCAINVCWMNHQPSRKHLCLL